MKILVVMNKDFRLSVEKLARQPVKLPVAYKLKAILKRINEEYAKFEESRKEVIHKYGEKAEDGSLVVSSDGGVNISPENVALFNKEIHELVGAEVDCGQVKLSDLGDEITLTTEDLMYLESIIDES